MGQKASHPDAVQQQGVNPQSTDDKAVVKRHRKTRAEVEAVVATELSVLEQLKVERPDLACLDWASENSVMLHTLSATLKNQIAQVPALDSKSLTSGENSASCASCWQVEDPPAVSSGGRVSLPTDSGRPTLVADVSAQAGGPVKRKRVRFDPDSISPEIGQESEAEIPTCSPSLATETTSQRSPTASLVKDDKLRWSFGHLLNE
mmetsp:Transcript_15835/g.25189  ORF Transcript_15835/g.25189 Transcript_15835/m.25189 type:complete len:205 (-) Transcript_15835:21-635(-)